MRLSQAVANKKGVKKPVVKKVAPKAKVAPKVKEKKSTTSKK